MPVKEVTVKWLESQRYVGVDGTGHGIVISSSGSDGGIGVRPTDLLLLSLGSCTAYDIVNILSKKRQKLTSLEVRVTGKQREEMPWDFVEFHVRYTLQGENLSEKAVREAVELSAQKYCSISATLKCNAEIKYEYEIKE